MAEKKLVTIAVKEPSKPWEIRSVSNDLKSYQDIVGGFIEHFGGLHGAELFCNEDGIMKELKFNIYFRGYPIFGNIFAVLPDEDDFSSLTDEQAGYFTNLGSQTLYLERE